MKHLGASEYDRINSDKLAPPVSTIFLSLKYYIDNSREQIMVTSRTRSGHGYVSTFTGVDASSNYNIGLSHAKYASAHILTMPQSF